MSADWVRSEPMNAKKKAMKTEGKGYMWEGVETVGGSIGAVHRSCL